MLNRNIQLQLLVHQCYKNTKLNTNILMRFIVSVFILITPNIAGWISRISSAFSTSSFSTLVESQFMRSCILAGICQSVHRLITNDALDAMKQMRKFQESGCYIKTRKIITSIGQERQGFTNIVMLDDGCKDSLIS